MNLWIAPDGDRIQEQEKDGDKKVLGVTPVFINHVSNDCERILIRGFHQQHSLELLHIPNE